MSLIKNLIVEPENKQKRNKTGKKGDEDDAEDETKPRTIVKSATDLQRLRLEKLMKNPDKPIVIPESPREKDYMQTVPSFVRNVMGSSAGAGSGEFHVYRHLRRKEYARQKTIQAKSMREQLDDEYQQKLDDNRRKAEEKTAKKRAKRLKRKQRGKKPREEQSKEAAEGADDKNDETSDDDDESEEIKATEESKVNAVVPEDTAVKELAPEGAILKEQAAEYTAVVELAAENTALKELAADHDIDDVTVAQNEQEGSQYVKDTNKETIGNSKDLDKVIPQTAEHTAIEDKTQTNDTIEEDTNDE